MATLEFKRRAPRAKTPPLSPEACSLTRRAHKSQLTLHLGLDEVMTLFNALGQNNAHTEQAAAAALALGSRNVNGLMSQFVGEQSLRAKLWNAMLAYEPEGEPHAGV